MSDKKNDETNYLYRVLQDGATIEVQLGEDRRADGALVPITRSIVASRGRVLTADVAPNGLAPHLEERYEAGDPHVRSLLERVEESEEGGVVSYTVVDQDEEAVKQAEAQAKALEQAAADQSAGVFDPLMATIGEVVNHLASADEDEQERVSAILDNAFGESLEELEDVPGSGDGEGGNESPPPGELTEEQQQAAAQAQEGVQATAPGEGQGTEGQAAGNAEELEGEALAEAGRKAGYPKLGDKSWSQLNAEQKREALAKAD